MNAASLYIFNGFTYIVNIFKAVICHQLNRGAVLPHHGRRQIPQLTKLIGAIGFFNRRNFSSLVLSASAAGRRGGPGVWTGESSGRTWNTYIPPLTTDPQPKIILVPTITTPQKLPHILVPLVTTPPKILAIKNRHHKMTIFTKQTTISVRYQHLRQVHLFYQLWLSVQTSA